MSSQAYYVTFSTVVARFDFPTLLTFSTHVVSQIVSLTRKWNYSNVLSLVKSRYYILFVNNLKMNELWTEKVRVHRKYFYLVHLKLQKQLQFPVALFSLMNFLKSLFQFQMLFKKKKRMCLYTNLYNFRVIMT